ncbi:MAG: dockerin type I repeat-containing protein [Phycisphaerae bacterium]
MRRYPICRTAGVSALFLAVAAAHGQLTIYEVPVGLKPNTPNQQISLRVSGGDLVTGVDLRAQITGPTGVSVVPIFQTVNFIGGIWDAYPIVTSGALIPGYQQYAQISAVFQGSSQTVAANGTFVNLVIDTTGISNGTFTLKLSNTDIGADTAFIQAGGTEVVPSITNNYLVVNPLPGDADLDGVITACDFAQLDAAYLKGIYNTSGAHWTNGDFNFDGKIDYQDYAIIDAAWSTQVGKLADTRAVADLARIGPAFAMACDAAFTQFTATTPEPTSLGLLGMGLLALLGKQRLRQQDRVV